MVFSLKSMGLFGINAFMVDVEVDFLKALPVFDIVGLPDAAIKESRDRVRYAFKNCGFQFPEAKVTVNLAPADIRKSGPIYDLPIFLAILSAQGELDADFSDSAFVGELSLSGEIREVTGLLPMAIHARQNGVKKLFVPAANAEEAAFVEGLQVFGIEHINQLISFLKGRTLLEPLSRVRSQVSRPQIPFDFCDVKGQTAAKRALEIAAAGGHNALLIGPPGSGKSMLAKRLPSILPDMTFDESMETTKIHSIAGLLSKDNPIITTRPFRAPHHTVSPAGLSGGGTIPQPGEISLAHNGVLFLDELPEFSRASMEILRQPIEDGKVTISRVNGSYSYPCSVMLIAAMNPCPCGYFGHPSRQCTCSPAQVSRYLGRVSGPLLDRLDLHIDVMPVEFESLASAEKAESSAEIKKRVDRAREIQNERYRTSNIVSNARITPAKLAEFCPIDDKGVVLLKNAFERLGLSARAYDRIVKVSRTIADLAGSEVIRSEHIAEAVQYRSLDRKYWSR